jgi:Domain of unknown function (DUF4352)
MRQVSPLLAAVCAALLTSCSPKAESQQVRTFNMGEKVTVGHMVYTVFETKWLTQLPTEPTPRVPKNRFFLVRLTAVNGGGGDVIVPDMSIEDDNGNTFAALTNGEGVPQWLGSLRKIAPAESAQGNVVFDAPPRHYKLRVTDEGGDQAALIDIPLSFNSETPDLQPLTAPVK